MLRRVVLLLAMLIMFTARLAAAGEREDYLLCVTEALGDGVDLADIGEQCLERIRPAEQRQPQHSAEEYPYEESLREVLIAEGSLFDPASAQFKDLVSSKRFKAWCGQMNAKNRMGGYVGWAYFAVRDRFRGSGKRREYIDFVTGDRSAVEPACKSYGAWVRENW